jgi:hypothetical protein
MSGEKPGVINTSALESQVKLAAEVGGPLPPLDETFPLSKIKPNTDTWYFSVECPKCRRTCRIFRDYSDGKLGNPFTGRGAVVAACHFCAHQIRAAPHAIASVLWR